MSSSAASASGARSMQQKVRRVGLVAGPLLAAALYWALPTEYRAADGTVVAFGHAGRATLAAMGWMATWWMTEAVAIEVTALLPIALFPLAGIMPLGRTTANYGADVIYLFFGGFVLALAIARWGLDRRIAFMTLRLVGTRPKAIVAGTMGATAFISMWVSNTATAAMMVPIVLSVIDVALRGRRGKSLAELGGIPPDDRDMRNFALSALLGVAYGASIGGLGTIIGSPPNGILVRFVEQAGGARVTFLEWMLIGVPAVLAFLPLAWFLNTFVMFPSAMKEIEGGREYVRDEWAKLGPMSAGRARDAGRVRGDVALWMTAPLLRRVHRRGRRTVQGAVGCRHRGRRGNRPLPHPGQRSEGHADGLGDRDEAAVGRADPVRRRTRARLGHRGQRGAGLYRQSRRRLRRLAILGCAARHRRDHGVHVRADVEHSPGRDHAADPRRAGAGARPSGGPVCWYPPPSPRAARS